MQVAMSNQQQRQMIWTRKLSQMDRYSQLASAKSEGREEGIYKILTQLVKNKRLSVAEAAAELGISESDFMKNSGLISP